jgi:hypothetical protein
MAFTNPFPVGYQPYGYNPYQQYQQPQMQQNAAQQQGKYVEVVPVNAESEAQNCPMAAGSSMVFFANDDSFIAVKSVGVNGQITFNVYDKRPPAPAEPPVDLSAYVRRDEIGELVAAAVAAQSGGKKGKKADDAEG